MTLTVPYNKIINVFYETNEAEGAHNGTNLSTLMWYKGTDGTIGWNREESTFVTEEKRESWVLHRF